MQLPKIKAKVKPNINAVLAFATIFIVIAELYLVYVYIYKSFTATPVVVTDGNIVRVDNTSYKSTIDLLDSLEGYSPDRTVPANINPLQ